MAKKVQFQHLGLIEYGTAWDYQEELMKAGLAIKAERFTQKDAVTTESTPIESHLLIVEHPHVYTLGKSGALENLLINSQKMKDLGVTFYKTNRGGDITYHGPGQVVAYPILDLEQFQSDLGWYMRSLEEVIIKTIAHYGLKGDRLPGSTGVWLDPDLPGRQRKICAMGVKCSRWITMHGLALNVNSNLDFFNYIVPCGITDKGVTSIEKELGHPVDIAEVEAHMKAAFEEVFGAELVNYEPAKA